VSRYPLAAANDHDAGAIIDRPCHQRIDAGAASRSCSHRRMGKPDGASQVVGVTVDIQVDEGRACIQAPGDHNQSSTKANDRSSLPNMGMATRSASSACGLSLGRGFSKSYDSEEGRERMDVSDFGSAAATFFGRGNASVSRHTRTTPRRQVFRPATGLWLLFSGLGPICASVGLYILTAYAAPGWLLVSLALCAPLQIILIQATFGRYALIIGPLGVKMTGVGAFSLGWQHVASCRVDASGTAEDIVLTTHDGREYRIPGFVIGHQVAKVFDCMPARVRPQSTCLADGRGGIPDMTAP